MSGRSEITQRHADLTDEAASWLAALDAGSADVAAFEAWREADVRHAATFVEVAATWRDLDGLRVAQDEMRRAGSAPSGDPIPAEPIFVEPISGGRASRRHVLCAAASIAAVTAVGGGVAYRANARDMAVTGIGQRKTVATAHGLSLDLR